ncbi:MAG TPA: hypothetical protein VLT32_00415, partial [Candidatus Sulfomarinibacteraceae bacterium]|nr:hypothetical protein [Candidatus Sulfomarinibacteraceae bacterium]
MRRRLTVLLVLVVVVPTGLLAWLAVRGVRDERRRVADQLGAAAASRLADLDTQVGRLLDDRARRLTELTDGIAPDDASARARAAIGCATTSAPRSSAAVLRH